MRVLKSPWGVALFAAAAALPASRPAAQPSGQPGAAPVAEVRAEQPFPAGVAVPSAAELRERVADQVFTVRLADGTRWRSDYRANGYFFIDTSTGFRGSGQWRAEDGKLCTTLRGRDAAFVCNDVRVGAEGIHLRRTSGEVILFEPR